jgi:hypothetical protein
VQVHGGMGFIEETGAAQHYRDARIAPIYEGTNGIQALDLVGRKVRANGGETLKALCGEIALTAEALTETSELAPVGQRLAAAVAALERAIDWLVGADSIAPLAAATPFLKLAGDVVGGWMLARQALATAGGSDDWSRSKAALARVYATQVLSLAPGQAEAVMGDAADLQATPAQALAS